MLEEAIKALAAIETLAIATEISSGAAIESSLSSKKKIQIPGAARAGLGLLIMGAIVVGLGQYWDRGSVSFFGLAMAAGGFALYIVASIVEKKRARARH